MTPFYLLRKNKKRVLVAMSGGVDSSVAALLLKHKGFDVVGATMCFGLEDSKSKRPSCCGVTGIQDAERVATHLGIPHYTLSFGKELQNKVIDNFINEYRQGRTPNPCVRCNQFLKFDLLLQKARKIGCDFLATGHYARCVHRSNGQAVLKKGKDIIKDQSYFLYRIPQETLGSILFPLGDLTKTKVRSIAKKNKLPVADKPASQDICFLAGGHYEDFLKERLGKGIAQPGPVRDTSGKLLGQHKGIVFYTIGQREGLGIAYQHALYVLAIDAQTNTLIVGEKKRVYRSTLIASDLNLLSPRTLPKELEVEAKIRYNHPQALARVSFEGQHSARVTFNQPQWAITPGQAVVFYQNDLVLGGGTIEKAADES